LANVAGLLEPGRLRVALVTSSSGLSQDIVEKSFRGAIQKKIPVLGLIENMKGYLCSQCGDVRPLFAGDATGLASRLGMAYLGGIPFDPEWSRLGDEGRLWETAAWHEPVQRAFENLGRTVIAGSEER
jgi:ATP-binding protein involved in chromosome partitioning